MKRLSPTRRLYIKVKELHERMERLVVQDQTPETAIELSRVERRYWPLQAELLRRMDERDALVAPRQVSLTPERIGQYMAGFSDSMKADDILRGGK